MIIEMKRFSHYIAFIILTLLTYGCTKEYEGVFQDSADERVRREMEAFKTQLLTAENGWKGYIYTGTGPGFLFFMEFRDDGYVTMISDFNESSGTTVQTTTYTMKGLQQPTLSFDTYAYIHLLADPSGSVNGGVNGQGLVSDFEFYLQGTSTDSLRLMGIKNGVPMVLVKATASEREKFTAGEVGETIAETDAYFKGNPFPWVQIGNREVAVELDSASKLFSFLYLDQSDNVIVLSSQFTYTPDGLYLRTPLVLGNSVIQEVHWDNNLNNFYILVNSQKIYFQEGTEPVIPLVRALGFLHEFVIMDESIDGYLEKLPAAFMDIYNEAKAGVFAIEPYKLELIAIYLQFDAEDNVNMYYFIQNSTGTYRAAFQYKMVVSSSDKATFTLVSTDPNGEVIEPGLRPLLDYFENNTFVLDYVEDADFGTMAGFYPEQTPGANFFGLIE
jgi:hypothetical protein